MKIKIDSIPSVYKENEVSTTLQPQDRQTSNVEVEKNEMVLKPDLSALHKAAGAKHTKGGTPVFLEPNSFIFSDDPILALTKKDYELFELKQGGSMRAKKNTPAEALKRSVDYKHYNKMSATLTDNGKDDIAKKTAALMLSKYLEKIGQIAFIQEDKKEFPDGIPQIAQGSAPVYDDDVKEEITQNKQYMKYGGNVLPKAQQGLYYNPKGNVYMTLDQLINAKNATIKANGIQAWINNYPEADDFIEKMRGTTNVAVNPLTPKGFRGYPLPPQPFNGASRYNTPIVPLYQPVDTPPPAFSGTSRYTTPLVPLYQPSDTPANSTRVGPNVPPVTTSPRKTSPSSTPVHTGALPPTSMAEWSRRYPNLTAKAVPNLRQPDTVKLQARLEAPEITGEAEQPFKLNSEINWLDKANIAKSLYDALNITRFGAYRSQIKRPNVTLNRLDPQGTLNNVAQAYNTSVQSNRAINPYLASSQNNLMFGRSLDAISQVRSQYDNQNSQIANQEEMTNNQINSQDAMANVGFDQQYYRDSVAGATNFNNMRSFLNNRAFETMTNAYSNAAQVSAMNMQLGPNAAYYYDNATMSVIPNPNRNIMNATTDGKSDLIDARIEELRNSSLPEAVKQREINRLITYKDYKVSNARKGGTFKRGRRY